jgi:flagella basal body P-ring formation protein FlgA
MSSASFTEIYGRIILTAFIVAVFLAIARAVFAAPAVVTPAAAIEQAVERRIGHGVAVAIDALDTRVVPEAGLQAHLEPGARIGQAMRVVLTVGRMRRGVATVTVQVSGAYARAARAIARDAVLTLADIETVDGAWPAVQFVRLPEPREVVGLTARRNIVPGEPLTSTVLDVPPLVRAGDDVVVVAKVGAVQVTGDAVASSSGRRGDTIRVTPKNGRPIRARITGLASVEVVR